MEKILLLCVSLFFCEQLTYSQPGQLDSSFGINGIVATDIGKNKDNVSLGRKVLVQPDGSMYIIFITPFKLYHPEVAVGITFISKKFSDGSTDSSYGNNGYTEAINISATDAALQKDGKIVIAGAPYFHDFDVARYNTNGTLDSTFSNDGKLTVPSVRAVEVQQDGKIVFGGGNSISRYNMDGSLDSTFSEDGVQTFNFNTEDISIGNDGKIVVAGELAPDYTVQRFTLARYNTNGNLDSNFADNGIYTNNDSVIYNALTVAIQNNGKIVVAGRSDYRRTDDSYNFFVWRFNVNGTLDKSFSKDGKQATQKKNPGFYHLLAIQSDGKIVAAAATAVIRYNADGSHDSSFSGDGSLTLHFRYASDRASSLAIQNNGKIIVAGYSVSIDKEDDADYVLARLNTNGSTDTTFANSGILLEQLRVGDTQFKSVAVQKDGKLVAAGITYNGKNEDFAVVRYNVNGTLDSSFSEDGKQTTDFNGASEAGNAVAIQSDGKIVVAGVACADSSDPYCGSKHFAIVRYNTDGALDNTFNGNGKQITAFNAADEATSIALQKDGKIVVAGNTSNFGASRGDFAIARYNTDGSLDNTFSGDGKKTFDYRLRNDLTKAVAIQDDGKILVAGSSGYTYGEFTIMRYNDDGNLDKTFGKNGIKIAPFNGINGSLAVQKDGKIIAVGGGYALGKAAVILARYNSNGSVDSSFARGGIQTTVVGDYSFPPFPVSMAIQNDGKIITASNYSYNMNLGEGLAFVRYNENGSLDSSFGTNGIQTENDHTVYGIAILKNKLYASGFQGLGFLYYQHIGFTGRYLLTDKSENSAPSVSIITPVNNQIIAGPAASVSLKAAATDIDGTISKVEFYNGMNLLHTEFTAPYTYTWANVPLGKYSLTAKATDNLGLVTVSANVNISVETNKAPTVSITDPVNNQIIGGPLTIHLKASATDIDGTISKVEFYNGQTLLHTETIAPYTFTWVNAHTGNYILTAKATDNFGTVTTSTAVNISVVTNNAPTVSITNPANNESFTTPANIPLVASAKDPDGTIIKVEFYNGTALINTQYERPYALPWKGVAVGTYTLTAKATDNLGLSATSEPVTITVTEANAIIVSSKHSSINNKSGLKDALNLKLYPNPATNSVNIHTTGLQQSKQSTISIISASGIVLKNIQINSTIQLFQLHVSELPKGVYTIKIISGEKVLYKKFVKL